MNTEKPVLCLIIIKKYIIIIINRKSKKPRGCIQQQQQQLQQLNKCINFVFVLFFIIIIFQVNSFTV